LLRWPARQRDRLAFPGRGARAHRSGKPAHRVLGHRQRADPSDTHRHPGAALIAFRAATPIRTGMPIWMELVVLMLVAYGAGLAIGWAIWGRRDREDQDHG